MPPPIDLKAWEFDLPADRIARHPPAERDAGRLLVVPRAGGLDDRRIGDLPSLLAPGDLVVVNATRVYPARVLARRASGGRCELLVLDLGPGPVRALVRPARKLRAGDVLALDAGGTARVCTDPIDGVATVDLGGDPLAVLHAAGRIPLPPYLGRDAEPADAERYQTIFAQTPGSAAAPTAGLHFTPSLVAALAARGVGIAQITLHVGLGTFRPLRDDDLARGRLHAEHWEVPRATADAIAATRRAGGRVVAVGTTTARTLEAATPAGARDPRPGAGETELFIAPGYEIRAFDALFTNFHLPGSSLLLLVGALLGRERTLAAYAHAVATGYRFYSYGDAMLVL